MIIWPDSPFPDWLTFGVGVILVAVFGLRAVAVIWDLLLIVVQHLRGH
jgi:hypothetical protein